MTSEVLKRMASLFAEAREAFLTDPSYVIEMAKQGSAVSERIDSRTLSARTRGVLASHGV